ncbi:MAG: GNAT family N-acetyltransferase [Acidimicrobiales bacterium]
MSGSDPRLVRLDDTHQVLAFDSGRPELDDWLKRHALAAQKMDSARTFVAARSSRVVGYFSLTMGSVLREEAPKALVRGIPAYPVPMVLVARLAVDRVDQRAGLGTRLLAEALRMAVSAGEAAAARLIVVDALDEQAAGFYRRHGFVAPLDNPLRLFRRMKDVRASLDAADS